MDSMINHGRTKRQKVAGRRPVDACEGTRQLPHIPSTSAAYRRAAKTPEQMSAAIADGHFGNLLRTCRHFKRLDARIPGASVPPARIHRWTGDVRHTYTGASFCGRPR